jgi:cation transport ATPase
MVKNPALRVALGADGVSIWSSEIFGGGEPNRAREFLSRAFAVQEVGGVELQRTRSFARIRYGTALNPAQIWRKLSRALSAPGDASLATSAERPSRADVGLLYLDGPGSVPVRVSRIGNALSTWRVRRQSEGRLSLWHPILRNRRDVVFRLEEELAAILGVEDFRASAITAGVSIRFDGRVIDAERLARELERAWPRLLEGLDGPPSQKRLVAAVGLAGLAYAGQYVVPALRPVAVAGMTLYAFPNVVNGVKDLTRGQIGLSALYSTGLAFMLFTGLPFTAGVMAALMQLWPHLAHRELVRTQRRLFAAQRRRPAWARRAAPDGVEREVSVDELRPGDRVNVRRGEVIPVDGRVEQGIATVVDALASDGREVSEPSPGDAVAAGARVHDGSLTIRVEATNAHALASHTGALLPRAPFPALPSAREAERVAHRNAKPALLLSALNLLLTRTLPPSQGAIRPDYATAPRLSAQLSALQSVARAWQQGVLVRNPAAIEHLGRADVYVLDDGAGLARRCVEVASIQTIEGVSAALVAAYARAAHPRGERGLALGAVASNGKSASNGAAVHPRADSFQRRAGVTRYHDGSGRAIQVASSRYVTSAGWAVPERFRALLQRPVEIGNGHAATGSSEPASSTPPLWVSRDGALIGVVSFARTGELLGRQVVAALGAQGKKKSLAYVSRGSDAEAQALARTLGIPTALGGLSPTGKVDFVRGLGKPALWIGDSADPDARSLIAASAVSISVAPASPSRDESADILLLQAGLLALPALFDVARAHARRLARDYRTVYAANLLGVAGAFLANFSPLQVGLLSNLGTGLVYTRQAWALERLALAAEQRRAPFEPATSR